MLVGLAITVAALAIWFFAIRSTLPVELPVAPGATVLGIAQIPANGGDNSSEAAYLEVIAGSSGQPMAALARSEVRTLRRAGWRQQKTWAIVGHPLAKAHDVVAAVGANRSTTNMRSGPRVSDGSPGYWLSVSPYRTARSYHFWATFWITPMPYINANPSFAAGKAVLYVLVGDNDEN